MYTSHDSVSPGTVAPQDAECEGFDITYARIASDASVASAPPSTAMDNQVDKKVDDSIESLLQSLPQIGPKLMSGCLTIVRFGVSSRTCGARRRDARASKSISLPIVDSMSLSLCCRLFSLGAMDSSNRGEQHTSSHYG
mmetsp:Transcript_5912/g.13166  ORF Transcript_5912/g.13166 Transcript_5912/m.13166 type:complete len:139 (+) Transcript_5912:138-554(+)